VPRRRLSLTAIGAFAAATMALAPTMAIAQHHDDDRGDRGAWHDRGGDHARSDFRRGDDDRGRDGPRRDLRDRRGYPRGYDRHRCRNGAGGTILGAIAGGLLGNAAAGYGDRTAGTIIGGGVGARAGSAIGRDC